VTRRADHCRRNVRNRLFGLGSKRFADLLSGYLFFDEIVPGGGISLDGTRWVACRPNCRAAHSGRCHQGGQRHGFDQRSARGAKSTRASMPLLRQQHAHHRDLLARATAETQTHANSAKDQDRHLMMTELMLDTQLNVRVGFQPTTLSLASSRQCRRSAKLKSATLRYKDHP
jgi:hypothetical protein